MRDAWSCPLPNEIFEVGSQGPGEDIAGLGVAIALGQLLSEPHTPGWLPALFNEMIVPLTGLGAPMPSFPFFDLHHVLERPPPRVLHQFVMVLVARFSMSVAEIVMAYALVRPHDDATSTTRNPAPATRSPYSSPTHQSPRDNQVEQARVLNPSLIRCHSVRSIFLGCCVLAVKMTREHTPSLALLHSLLEDVFNLLKVELLIRIEHQLLEVLEWRLPTGAVYQNYADEIFRVAADALLAPPMQAPQVLLPWLPPVHG